MSLEALNTDQLAALDNLSPRAVAAGVSLGTLINEILTALTEGNLGISSAAYNVDSVCDGANSFARNADTTVGLTFGHRGGRVLFGQTVVVVGAGTVALTGSATNYVEVSAAGTVSANTSGFTVGQFPLYEIVCGVSDISTVTNRKTLLVGNKDGGVVGKMMSTAAKTKSILIDTAATKSATFTLRFPSPNTAAKVTRVQAGVETTVTANDTNYWTLGLVNKGPAGSGTTAVVDNTVAANSTKATGGSGLTANVMRSFTLHTTPSNLDTAANDLLVMTVTKAASGADLVNFCAQVDWTFEG